MPRYGDKVYLPSDRWAIVNHVRKLQGAGAAARPSRPAAAARHPAGAERDRLDRREAPMSPTLHERLVQRSVAGRYDLFLGLGGGLAILGLILFVSALGAGQTPTAPGSCSTSTGSTSPASPAGSVAFVAVQKITNAKWSGMIIRFAAALGGVPAGLAARRCC